MTEQRSGTGAFPINLESYFNGGTIDLTGDDEETRRQRRRHARRQRRRAQNQQIHEHGAEGLGNEATVRCTEAMVGQEITIFSNGQNIDFIVSKG